MKPTWLLAAGIAIGMLGTGTYLTISNQSRAAVAVHPTPASARTSGAVPPVRSRKPLWPRIDMEREAARDVASPSTARTPEMTPPEHGPSRGTDSVVDPTQQELAIAADRINQSATRKLARLADLLDLSEAQQDQVFPLLARSAPAYHPSLAIEVGGTSATGRRDETARDSSDRAAEVAPPPREPGSNEPLLTSEADEQIHDFLTAEQQQKLQDELIEEDLWWTEIIADLEDELDESQQASPPLVTEPEGEPVDTSYQGNTGIGGLLQQAAEADAGNTSGSAATATDRPPIGRGQGQ